MDDIIVIGGGIAGVSIAARISKFMKVTLLEREDSLGYHASGRSAAVFLKDYGNNIVKALNHASCDYLEKANGGVLSPRGLLMLGSMQDNDSFTAESQKLGLTQVSLKEAKLKFPLLNPQTTKHAAYREDIFDLDTDLFLQNFLREAKKNNAQVKTKSEVCEIIFQNNYWKIRTQNGEYSGKVLINASGAWVDEIAILAGITPINFTPYRRSVARVPVPGAEDPSPWPLLLGVNEAWYAKPDAGALIVSPAEEELVSPQDAWAEDLTLAEGIDRFQQFIVPRITSISSNWAGLRTFSPDRSLVIGHSKENSSFFWFGGQGGYGFQTAAAASELAMELLLGNQPSLPSDIVRALAPGRFN